MTREHPYSHLYSERMQSNLDAMSVESGVARVESGVGEELTARLNMSSVQRSD